MDKEAENKIETQNNNEIIEEITSQKPKKSTKQPVKKTTSKKPDSQSKNTANKTGTSQSKKSAKKADETQETEIKKTSSKNSSAKPKTNAAVKKTTAKKEQPKTPLNSLSKDAVIKTDEQVIKADDIKTSEEISVFEKKEKQKPKTVKKASPKKKQAADDKKSVVQDEAVADEAVLPADVLEPLKKSDEPEIEITAEHDEEKHQNEQTITIHDISDSDVLTDESKSELYELEASSGEAAVIAQTAISQEALLPNNATVFVPQAEKAKSIYDAIRKAKNLLIYGIITLFLIAVYLGFAQYFKTHFYLGTTINGISIAGLSLEDANIKLNTALQNYTLTIIERGDLSEQIKSQDISLSYNSINDLQTFIDAQNGFDWVGAVFSKNSKKTIAMSYDTAQLKTQINNLSCLKPENIIKPKNASFNYVNGSYEIVPEIIGNEINNDTLYSTAADSVSIMNTSLDLEKAECYTKPLYTASSQKTVDTQNLLNTYASVNITYIIGTEQIIINSAQICAWMSVDNDLNILFNKNKIQSFVNNLENISSSITYIRNFKTTSGNMVTITGGNYGRYMSFAKENDFIISTIKSGVSATRDFNEIGNTYVEISLSKQHIWYYKDGTLIVDGSIVTGSVKNHTQTRKGAFYLRSKSRNATLVGDDYEVDVSYWMPFDRGIGLHDAPWRSYFGGSIYRYNGSHGCVNLPYYVAKKIYNNISVGTPVVVY